MMNGYVFIRWQDKTKTHCRVELRTTGFSVQIFLCFRKGLESCKLHKTVVLSDQV